MKQLIFIATIIASTNLIVAMEPESPYQKMLIEVSQSAVGKPSITLISHDLPLEVSTDDGYKRSTICLQAGIELRLSPYGHPFFLNTEQKKHGAILQLSMFVQKKHRLNLHIGGNSVIKSEDTIQIDHDEDNHKIHIIHNGKKKLETLHTSDDPIEIGLPTTKITYSKSRFLKKSQSMK